MDHTFFNRAFKVIGPGTWKQLNLILGRHAAESD